jgi:pentatricopeptide repeat protein
MRFSRLLFYSSYSSIVVASSMRIPKQQNIGDAFKIYNDAKHNGVLDLTTVNAMLAYCRKQNSNTHQELWMDAMSQLDYSRLTTLYILLRECIFAGRVKDSISVLFAIDAKRNEVSSFDIRVMMNSLLKICIQSSLSKECITVFQFMKQWNVQIDQFHYPAILKIYVQLRDLQNAVLILHEMEKCKTANAITYTILFTCCADTNNLNIGRQLHQRLNSSKDITLDIQLLTSIVNMYGKCGSLTDSEHIFSLIPMEQRNIVTWNAMINIYCISGNITKAMDTMNQMENSRIVPNKFTFSILFGFCAELSDLTLGKRLHKKLRYNRIYMNTVLANSLINMYGKCGSVTDAENMFYSVPEQQRDIVTWTAMINAYCVSDNINKAVNTMNQMEMSGIKADAHIFSILFTGCSDKDDISLGRILHQKLRDSKISMNYTVMNSLINMYGNCGSVQEAENLFRLIPYDHRSVVTWTAMIKAYSNAGNINQVMKSLSQMKSNGIEPNSITYRVLLTGCAYSASLTAGTNLHQMINSECNIVNDTEIINSLINMYGKCGSVTDAENVFYSVPVQQRDIVTWTAMINAYCLSGNINKTIDTIDQMEKSGIKADAHIYSIMNSLINMYGNCGSVQEAENLFHSIPDDHRSVVSWTALIKVYCNADNINQAMKSLSQMKSNGIEPNSITYSVLLTGCANTAAFNIGTNLHQTIKADCNISIDIDIINSLINMYGKCGSVTDAENLFYSVPEQQRDIVTWTAMINTYALNGLGVKALKCFNTMVQFVVPNDISIACVLNACSHAGKVDEALEIYYSMGIKWNITVTLVHTVCIVDAMARKGMLDEAEQLLSTKESNVIGWMALLSACRIYRDVTRAERVFAEIQRHTPESSTNACAHVLLANTYALNGLMDQRNQVRNQMDKLGLKKDPGQVFVEMGYEVHKFYSEDHTHLEIEDMYLMQDGIHVEDLNEIVNKYNV